MLTKAVPAPGGLSRVGKILLHKTQLGQIRGRPEFWFLVCALSIPWGPDSFQWCPETGQGATGINWSRISSVWTWGRTSSLWGWWSTGKGCPGKLWSLLLWRYSRPVWTQSCAACCRWPCFGRGVGPDDPQRSLPTPNILSFCDSVIHKWFLASAPSTAKRLWFGFLTRRGEAVKTHRVTEPKPLSRLRPRCVAFRTGGFRLHSATRPRQGTALPPGPGPWEPHVPTQGGISTAAPQPPPPGLGRGTPEEGRGEPPLPGPLAGGRGPAPCRLGSSHISEVSSWSLENAVFGRFEMLQRSARKKIIEI